MLPLLLVALWAAQLNRSPRAYADEEETLRLTEPVERLEFAGRRCTAVVTAQGRYEADAVVLNATPAGTHGEALEACAQASLAGRSRPA